MIGVPTVSEPAAVKALFAKTMTAFGRVDVLFNNAGTNAPGVLFEDLPWEKWKAVVDANLNGMFLCSQEAYKIMKIRRRPAHRGNNISAHVPRPIRRYTRPSTRYRASAHYFARWPQIRHRLLPGRCGQRHVDPASRMAKDVKQDTRHRSPEPMISCEDVALGAILASQPPGSTSILDGDGGQNALRRTDWSCVAKLQNEASPHRQSLTRYMPHRL
jgi:hypothetical protein